MVGHGIRGRNVGAVAVVGCMWAVVGALEVGTLGVEAVGVTKEMVVMPIVVVVVLGQVVVALEEGAVWLEVVAGLAWGS